MHKKTLPFSERTIREIAREYPTPFHIYDEKAIRRTARDFAAAFEWAPSGFRNYYAVKACPNPWLLELLAEEGMGADSSSMAELLLSEAVGITGERAFFSSNDTPLQEYLKAKEMGAVINLDDITHLSYLEQIGLPDTLSFRFNPGSAKTGNAIIGEPEEAKYGLTREQMIEAYSIARDKGVKRFGIHTMVASNELNAGYFVDTAEILLELLADITDQTGITIEFINFGGGIGIPYRPEEDPVDLNFISSGIKKRYTEYIVNAAPQASGGVFRVRPRRHRTPRVPGYRSDPRETHLQGIHRREFLHGRSDEAGSLRRLPSYHRDGQGERSGNPYLRCGGKPL